MSEAKPQARPSQVTMAGWIAAAGSTFLVLMMFDSMTRLQSLEVREAIEEFLATPTGSGLGLEVGETISLMRGLMLFSGAAAAAAAVFAIFVLQRHRAARVGFTVAAGLLLVSSLLLVVPASGGFLAFMIAFAAYTLWTKPARDWFNGVTPAQSEAQSQAKSRAARSAKMEGVTMSTQPPERPHDERPAEGTPEWPRMPAPDEDRPAPPPTQGFGSPPQQGSPPYPQGGQQPPNPGQQPWNYPPPQYGGQAGAQYGGQPGYYGQPADPGKRPTTVTIAAVITWAVSGLTLIGLLLSAVALAAMPDDLFDQVRQDPAFQDPAIRDALDRDSLMAIMWVVVAVMVFWTASAIVLAWFAFRRQNWARITLVVSSAITLLFSVFAIPVSLLNFLGAGAVIVLLFVGGANPWFRKQAAPMQVGPYGGQPDQHDQQETQDRPKNPPNVW